VLVERLAVALQGSLLDRHAPPAVADAFRSRRGSAYGTLGPGVDNRSILERHRPILDLTTA
jgi:putative acyl-CoA dehydrogenase